MQQHVSWQNCLAVFAGGGGGGLLRHGVNLSLGGANGLWATTCVNLLGSFLLALLTFGLAAYFGLPEWLILGLGTGAIGGFTTFSALMVGTVTTGLAGFAFLGANLVGGLGAVGLGYLVARAAERRWW